MADLQPYVGEEWRLQPHVVAAVTLSVRYVADPVIVHEDSAPVLALPLAWLGLGPGLELGCKVGARVGWGSGLGSQG